jgi:alpha-N-acetylglucosaminidase
MLRFRRCSWTDKVPRTIIGQSPSINSEQDVLYDPSTMVKAWSLLHKGALFADPAFRYDMIDITRHVLSNAFLTTLPVLVSKYKSGSCPPATNSCTFSRPWMAS